MRYLWDVVVSRSLLIDFVVAKLPLILKVDLWLTYRTHAGHKIIRYFCLLPGKDNPKDE